MGFRIEGKRFHTQKLHGFQDNGFQAGRTFVARELQMDLGMGAEARIPFHHTELKAHGMKGYRDRVRTVNGGVLARDDGFAAGGRFKARTREGTRAVEAKLRHGFGIVQIKPRSNEGPSPTLSKSSERFG